MSSSIEITPRYRQTLKLIEFNNVERVFNDERLRVWRDLEDRDNSTLDVKLADGRELRLHVKRDKYKRSEPMALEARGIQMLEAAGIASAPLVAHGHLDDRTFVVTENLDGYMSADRLMETNVDRLPILAAMIDVAAKLHNAGLHHRDLYANHFYMRPAEAGGYDVRLIDTARVRRLPLLFCTRWIVKDVAQLIFSLADYTSEPAHVLASYATATRRSPNGWFARWVLAKVDRIDRHDQALRAKKPKRNLRLADGN